MAIDYDAQEYIAALGNIGSGNNKPGESYAGVVDNLGPNITSPGGYMPFPTTDPSFSSGLQYAMSIADGQNVPNMIAPGVSYSAANPQGFTQADLSPIVSGTPEVVTDTPPDDPSYCDTGIGGVNIPGDRKQDLPPADMLRFFDMADFLNGTFDFSNLNTPVTDFPMIDPNPFADQGYFGTPKIDDDRVELPIFGPGSPGYFGDNPEFLAQQQKIRDELIAEGFDPDTEIKPYGLPVDMPMPPKINDQLFIDDMPRFNDMPSTDYVVPEVPLNNLLNQNPPQGPVGMSPQETAKMSSQLELSNLIDNKDILKEIPADDGVRNQYQVELDKYINKSPINMDTYKEELPIGSAINLGIPSIMDTVVPMAVPGLGLAKNISNPFSSNNNPSSAPRRSSPSSSRPSRSGIDYSSVRRFGR